MVDYKGMKYGDRGLKREMLGERKRGRRYCVASCFGNSIHLTVPGLSEGGRRTNLELTEH